MASIPGQPPEDHCGSLITALGIGQICSWGSLYYSFPLIAEAMSADLGWSKTELYSAATVGLTLAAAVVYHVGVAIDRGHGRTVMAGASFAAAILLALWSMVESLPAFYLLIAGLGVVQAATLYEPAFAVIARRVGPARSRRGITALTLWGGFASTVFIPLVQFVLDHGGWRDALLVLAFINATVCTGAHLIFIRPKLDVGNAAGADRANSHAEDRHAVHAALFKPAFWALAIALTAYAAMFSGFTFHMYPLLLERGISTIAVVAAIATIGPAQVAGRILISVFAARVSMRRIGSVVVTIFPLIFGVLLLLPSSVWLITGVCITYGLVNGIFTIVRGLVVPEMLSRRAYGAINGLLTIPVTLARALAPAACALIWTATGSYNAVLAAIIALAALQTMSFWLAAWLSRD